MKKLLTNYILSCFVLCSFFTTNLTAQCGSLPTDNEILTTNCDLSSGTITVKAKLTYASSDVPENFIAFSGIGENRIDFTAETYIPNPTTIPLPPTTVLYEAAATEIEATSVAATSNENTVGTCANCEETFVYLNINIPGGDTPVENFFLSIAESASDGETAVVASECSPYSLFSMSLPACSPPSVCAFDAERIEAVDFDCQQGSSGRLNFTVKFDEPTNGSGSYGLYDGDTYLGEYYGRTTSTAYLANFSCVDCEEEDNRLEISANYYTQVTAGNRTLTLKDYNDENCSIDFEVAIPACKGTVTITEKEADCVAQEQGDELFTTVAAAANIVDNATSTTSANEVPNVNLTIQAGDENGAPYSLSVYYRHNGEDIYLGTAYDQSDFASLTGRTLTFSSNLPATVSGDVLFTVVNRSRRKIYRPTLPSEDDKFTLNPADFFYFAQTTITIPNCADSDGDGTADTEDECPDDANKTVPGACGCGNLDTDTDEDGKADCVDDGDDSIDSDGDGIPDYLDEHDDRIDRDGDGIPDYLDPGDDRIDTDGDGTPDYLDFCDDSIDSDNDGTSDCKDKCPFDPNKIEPDACGCGEPDQTDSDGDGIINCYDPCPYDLDQYVDGRLECGRTVKSDTRLGDRITDSYGECSDISFTGRELFYKLTLHDAGSVTVRFKEIGSGTRELQLFVLDTLCSIDSCVGTIRGNPGVEETLVLEDLEAGDYYFAVDSRSFYDRAEFELTVDCGVDGVGSIVTCPEDALLSEDFEGYEAGTDIVPASDDFELFGFSSTSANVVEIEGETPNKAIYFDRSEAASDIVFLVGNQQQGIRRIAWNMFVKPNRGATFQLFGHESTVNFGVKYQIDTDDTDLQGKWMAIEAFIDLSNNKYTLFIDNRAIVVTGDYLPGLARLNFYAYWNNAFYVDNLCYGMVESVPTASRVAKVENALLENVVKPTAATTITSNTQADFETDARTTTATPYSQDLEVYPNPTKDILNVNLSLATEMSLTLELIDQMGRTVQSIQTAKTNAINQQLNVSDLANGLYILRAYNKEMVLTKRIIKQ